MSATGHLCDVELEKNLLGACLADPSAVALAAEHVSPEDFSYRFLGRAFGRILELSGAGKPSDVSCVALSFRGDPEFESLGGESFLRSLSEGVFGPCPVASWAEILKTHAVRRILANEIEESRSQIQSLRSTEEILDCLNEKLSALREGVESSQRSAVQIGEALRELQPILEKSGQGGGLLLGRPTGFRSLDQITAGWCPGNYCLLAARPSGGKSALGLEFALSSAKRGDAVAIFSLEMSRESLLLRLLCREAKIDLERLRTGSLSTEGWLRIPNAIVELSRLPILIDDRRGVRLSDLRWRIRSLARRYSLRLVIVDYLQLLKAPGEKRYEQVTTISMELQAAAGDLGHISGGTLLATAQLNRLAAAEEPQLHHLRDSGQLEQDTDVVFFIWDPDEKKRMDGDPTYIELKIAKQRNGRTGRLRFEFAKPFGAFFE